jgi:hypothetical protein
MNQTTAAIDIARASRNRRRTRAAAVRLRGHPRPLTPVELAAPARRCLARSA